MKKAVFLIIAACGALSTQAQTADASNNVDSLKMADTTNAVKVPKKWLADSMLSRWVLDVNGMAGMLTQDITTANTAGNYTNAINPYTGKLKFDNGMSFGGDLQIGFFPGHKGHWGFGVGAMYLRQQGDMTMDKFNIQYQSTDNNGNTFRQVLTSKGAIKEKLTMTNINIPITLKYKNRFTYHSGFTGEVGVMYNVQLKNEYTTNAKFDYEAIYQYAADANGNVVPVYDYASTPATNDWLITRGNVRQSDVQEYFNGKYNQGFNVGLDKTPAKTKGSAEYSQGSIGFLGRLAYSYYFNDVVALNIGGYYMMQQVNNNVKGGYRLTDKVGDYASITNSVSKSTVQSYGLDLGLRFYLGKYKPNNVVAAHRYSDLVNPSICGVSDGAVLLHGLAAGEAVTVNFVKDGVPQPVVADTVSPFGTVKLNGLSAASYTGIVATVGMDTFNYDAVTLVNPPLGYFSESSNDPLSNNACDGTMTMHGLHPGLPVTVNYKFNGTPQTAFTGVLSPNGTVTIRNLCAGTYSSIVVKANTCVVNGTDITLKNPPAPPPPPVIKPTRTDVSTPILFDVNKTSIHKSSYPVLDEAVLQLDMDENASIVIDGFTDNTGSVSYNKVLSVKRANAVKHFLVNRGVSPRRLQTIGHGINDPIAPNSTPEGRAKNRRVIMSLRHNSSGINLRKN